MLGVRPLLGRVFTEAEDMPGGDPVAVIAYGLWQRRFAGDPGVIGRQVSLDGLRPGVTIERARADLGAVTTRLEQQFPGTNRDVSIQDLKHKVVGDIEPALLV